MMHQICRVLDATLKKPEYQTLKVVFHVSKEPNDVTNAVFLLGAFLCAFLGATPKEAWQPFQGLDRRRCLPYRDATWVRSPYDLCVQDCWGGLVRALEHGMYRPLEFNHQEVVSVPSPAISDHCLIRAASSDARACVFGAVFLLRRAGQWGHAHARGG